VNCVCGWVCGGYVWVSGLLYECGVCGCVRVCVGGFGCVGGWLRVSVCV
jgi:hypothetical protein